MLYKGLEKLRWIQYDFNHKIKKKKIFFFSFFHEKIHNNYLFADLFCPKIFSQMSDMSSEKHGR